MHPLFKRDGPIYFASVTFWAVLCLLLVVAFNPKKPVDVPIQGVYNSASHSAVLLHPSDGGFGSGVLIKRLDPQGKERWFAWTAAHVVDKTDLTDVVFFTDKGEEKTFHSHVIARSQTFDAALVSLDENPVGVSSAEFSFSTTELGQEIFVVGSPYGKHYYNMFSFGRISGYDRKLAIEGWDWERLDIFSGLVFPGDSGGPAFNADGKVVGLVVGRSPVCSFYLPNRYLATWADSHGFGWALVGEKCPAARGEFDVPGVDLK